MKELICAICGEKKKISLKRGICKDCLIKEGIINEIKEINLTICKGCYKVKFKNWKKFISFQTFLEDSLFNKIILKDYIKLSDVEFNLDSSLKFGIANIEAYLDEFNEYITLSVKIPIKLNKILCTDCIKFKTENYEAIIQLRSKDKRIINLFNNFLNEFSLKLEPNEIIKSKKFNYGVDVYFNHISIARKIARIFCKKYKLKFKETVSAKHRFKYKHTILLK